MDFSTLNFIRLSKEHVIKPFDCNDKDLNDFFLNSSHAFLSDLLGVTYILEDESKEKTIAFFTLLNDKISIKDVEGNKEWNAIRKRLPHRKKLMSYPAMKIGRLGVSNDFKKKGYGAAIIDYLKLLFITNNRTGCKFITVDAYSGSLRFYEKNGFKYLTEKDKDQDTRQMYFDLIEIKNALAAAI